MTALPLGSGALMVTSDEERQRTSAAGPGPGSAKLLQLHDNPLRVYKLLFAGGKSEITVSSINFRIASRIILMRAAFQFIFQASRGRSAGLQQLRSIV